MLHDMLWDDYTHKEKGTDKGRVQMKLLGDVDTFVLLSGDESDGHVAPRHDVCLSLL